MPRLIFTYLVFFLVIYFAVYYFRKRKGEFSKDSGPSRQKFRAKPDKGMWIQVYDTDSLDEAKQVVARLEEEEIDCFYYEQGRRDIHGNPLKDYGIIVPRTSASRAQTVISRLPV